MDDDREHIRHLLNYFRDKRYIKINGKPILVMYRPELHPNITQAAAIWREEVKTAGFEDVYLVRVENGLRNIDPKSQGFDAAMEFAPDAGSRGPKYLKRKPINYVVKKALHYMSIRRDAFFENRVFDYNRLVDNMLNRPPVDYKRFRMVCPSWDNSARRTTNATIYLDSTPEKFRGWVREMAAYTASQFEGDEQLLFVNAWNEWGEGCHLEPDQRNGLDYLQAFKDGLNSY